MKHENNKSGKRTKEKKENNILKFFINMIKTFAFLAVVAFVLNKAPNYIKDDREEGINLVINNNNVTKSLRSDVQIDREGIIYLSMADIENFFDGHITLDEKYNLILTGSSQKTASIGVSDNYANVNGSKLNLYGSVIKVDGKYFLPFSELGTVYNLNIEYKEKSNTVVVDSLDREQKMANISSDTGLKYLPTFFSKDLLKLHKGDSVVVVSGPNENKGWYKIRTESGELGYVKKVANEYVSREKIESEKPVKGKVSLAWDYFSEYGSAPDRSGQKYDQINVVSPHFIVLKKSGKGNLDINIGEKGQKYIEWAHSNGYKVWPMISNNSYQQTTSEILEDYWLRQNLIENLLNTAVKYKFDGLNMDFENIDIKDKDLYSRFIIELSARMKEYGLVLSVDVTAPDGSEDWSLCFDRKVLADVSDYLVFMAYDQHGSTSSMPGTVAGYDWVETNIKKFLGQEGVSADKLVLAMPFYTRFWKIADDGKFTSVAVNMNDTYETIPVGVEYNWNDTLKQFYSEYTKSGVHYKVWIEDEKSIDAKFSLMEKYKLSGAAYWSLGNENEDIWDIAKKYINN